MVAGLAWQGLGLIAQQQGDDAQATAQIRASLELSWALGTTENLVSLLGYIGVAAHQRQWERAAWLCGAVEVLSTNLNRPFTPLQQADYDRAFAPVRARCNEPAVAAAWAQGQTMTLEQAVAYASTLAPIITVVKIGAKVEAAPIARELAPIASLPPTYPAGLTNREVEVLRLLAQRLTYPEIAEKLVISRRTVNAHVTSIYSKLGVTTREAATRFAVDHHLV